MGGGGRGRLRGIQFSKGLNFEVSIKKCEKGRKICRQKKIASLPATKFYPYIAWPSNLSAIKLAGM